MMEKLAKFQGFLETAVQQVVVYLPKLLLALILLVIGLRIIKLIIKGLEKGMTKAQTDETLMKFFSSFISILLKIILLISVASMIGVETTSFVAVLGAAGLAIGFALQGSLGNLAGGLLILLFKPFKVGDFIEAQGFLGKVHSIQILNTILKTPDNKTVHIPNGQLSGGAMTNFSTEPQRRVDMTFGIGYDDDIKKVKDVLHRLVQADNRILKDPEPMIALSELGDSSVNLVVRVWVNSSDYWGVFFDMQQNVKITFDGEGISIPFPQRDIHLYQKS
jgi:small conductance mechanosensitive channel